MGCPITISLLKREEIINEVVDVFVSLARSSHVTINLVDALKVVRNGVATYPTQYIFIFDFFS